MYIYIYIYIYIYGILLHVLVTMVNTEEVLLKIPGGEIVNAVDNLSTNVTSTVYQIFIPKT